MFGMAAAEKRPESVRKLYARRSEDRSVLGAGRRPFGEARHERPAIRAKSRRAFGPGSFHPVLKGLHHGHRHDRKGEDFADIHGDTGLAEFVVGRKILHDLFDLRTGQKILLFQAFPERLLNRRQMHFSKILLEERRFVDEDWIFFSY